MKWFQRKTQKQAAQNEPKSAEPPMLQNRKIPQVITGEKLLEILKLWNEFSNWRKQSPPQIVTGILAKMVGLIMNDTFSDSAAIVDSPPSNPPCPYTTLVLVGERSWSNQIRLYQTGITISQLSKTPTIEEILQDPEDWVYYTMITHQVEGTSELLNILHPERKFVFVYGTSYFKEPCTNRKIFISSLNTNPTSFDEFLIVKDRYANSNRDTISWEFVWSTGDVYAMQCQLPSSMIHPSPQTLTHPVK
jgi:hypothetical protein